MSSQPVPLFNDVLAYLRIGLTGLQTLLGMLKLKSDVPAETIAAVEAAIAALEAVHGNEVVLAELESLRTQAEW